MQIPQQTLETLEQHQQSHLVQWWEELDDSQQEQLLHQIDNIDFNLVDKLIAKRDAGGSEESGADRAKRATSPEQLVRLPESDEDHDAASRANRAGEELLREGKVGAILVAGGQGSRLGFDLPKGMFPIGPVTDRTLFQILCEQLLARSKQAGVTIPYFIMTSEATNAPTVEFFQQNDYFGLGEENVFFFQQASLPAVDDSSSQILLASKGRVATSPDGHGGMLRALQRNGMLEVMRERGVEHLYYHQVDNPTAIVCDPTFLGYHYLQDSDLTTKVVEKVSPEEKMGVLVTVDRQTQIIEYSDLPGDLASKTDAEGNYIFWAGNTAVHVFKRAFIEELLTDDLSLPFHIAHKKVACIDDDGEDLEPTENNANKFEQFIFDALPHAKVALVVEGDRNREFNPVKNAEGADSPQTSRSALGHIYHQWLHEAGGQIDGTVLLEISPLAAMSAEDLKPYVDGQVFSQDTVIEVSKD